MSAIDTSVTPAGAGRPTISELVRGPTGTSFTITFLPRQELPKHQNASRLVLTVLDGDGTLTVDDQQPVALSLGSAVLVEGGRPHSLRGGPTGMVVEVRLSTPSCSCC